MRRLVDRSALHSKREGREGNAPLKFTTNPGEVATRRRQGCANEGIDTHIHEDPGNTIEISWIDLRKPPVNSTLGVLVS